MPDARELDERKSSILSAIVEEYIQTAQPVGSSHVAHSASVAVSSATIRNDMAYLEREGFLVQPHTSAGRVPTEKGYRFFVDHLAQPDLAPLEAQTVGSFFDRAHSRLEEMLQETSRLLSRLTSYAGVVVGPPSQAAAVRHVQLVGLGGRQALVVLVLSNGTVNQHAMELDGATTEAELAAATARLNLALVGRSLLAGTALAASGDAGLDQLIGRVLAVLGAPDEDASGRVYVGGASNVAGAFTATETVRNVLALLEEQIVVVSLIRDLLGRGVQVAIGTETGMAPLAECSLVVAPYSIDGEPIGSIGVLGPTRMNYPQALAAVAVVSRRLGHRLSEGPET
ncbi:MAG: heat-inducible transcriptional repressor HrcA [Acidimicrobiales bacterium]